MNRLVTDVNRKYFPRIVRSQVQYYSYCNISEWKKTKNVYLTIMPAGVGTDKREIPKNISIDYSLINKAKKSSQNHLYIRVLEK